MTPTLLRPDEVTGDLRRREFLGVLAAAGLLAACGPDGGGDGRATAGFPRRVRHAGGSTELDAPPERIYTFGGGTVLDPLLALDVLPALYSPYQAELLPWQRRPGMAQVPVTGDDGVGAERLATLDVDFAMLSDSDWASEVGAQVRAYCPSATPPVPFTSEDGIRLWGRVLGRDDDAADLLAEYEAGLQRLRTGDDRSVLAIVALEDGVFVYQEDFQVGEVLQRAGFTLKRFPDQGGRSFELSLERLGEFDTDLLVLSQPYGPDPVAEALQEQPLFASLPAVEGGRFLALDTVESAALLPSPLALPTTARVLDRLRAL